MGKKGVPHRKFSKEDKLKIIREHLDGHEAIEALEKKYKIGHSTIANWIRIYIEDGEEALTPHNGNPYAALHTSKNLSEVDRLRLIIAKQEVEIARLKKDITWKELVQTRCSLPAKTRIRSDRRTADKVSGAFSLRDHGRQPIRIL